MNKYFDKYTNIIIEVQQNIDDILYIVDYFYNVIKVKNITEQSRYNRLLITNEVKSYIRYNNNHITYSRFRSLESTVCRESYEKVFTIDDIKNGTIKNLIERGTAVPNYKPKKIIRSL